VHLCHSLLDQVAYLQVIFARKKCRKSNAFSLGVEEKDIVFSYPVTQGGDQSKQLGLANESRPYFLGRSTQMTIPWCSPHESHDGRPDSSAELIDVSDVGLTPTTSASGSLATELPAYMA
jgi:hypothetical protein